MSGSSLDGLDIAHVLFQEEKDSWSFEIIDAHCFEYDIAFSNELRQLPTSSAFELAAMHTRLGELFGRLTKQFIEMFAITAPINCIVSHGQTIFHQTDKHFTLQIGNGAAIAAICGMPVVCDLRSKDVALGGQGAPLVPCGEKYLFPNQYAFLNIGGISNISFHQDKIVAYDVCPGNTLMNHYAALKGKSFDDEGAMARSGKIIPELLKKWNDVAFCKVVAPKSLGTEHIFQDWIVLDDFSETVEDKLTTAAEHIAMQIGFSVKQHPLPTTNSMLITGGGALNTYLVERIAFHCGIDISVPDKKIIQYKEALIIAFLGLQRWLGKNNAYSSVTGASVDSCGGAIYI